MIYARDLRHEKVKRKVANEDMQLLFITNSR